MLLKLSFLLFWHLVNGSHDLLSNIKIDEKMELTRAAITIMDKICNDPTINFIYLNHHHHSMTLEGMIKIASLELRATVQLESTNHLNYTPIASKSCNVFTITSLNDFKRIYSLINPQLFNYRKHFLIVSHNYLPPAHIEQIFNLMWQKFILNANLIAYDSQDRLVVSTFFPFKAHACNDTRPVIVNYFKNGEFINDTDHLITDKLSDLQGCPLRVVTSYRSEPFVIIENVQNETKFSGRDINLIQTLAKSLNFRTKFIVLEEKGFLLENGSSEGIFKYLSNGSADLALNDLWITRIRKIFFDVTTPYFYDDLIFVIPAVAELNSLEKLIYPFSVNLWKILIGCLLAGCFVIIVIKFKSKTVQNFVFGRGVKNQFYNMWAGILGTTQQKLPRRNFARFLLMKFLLFSLVVRTAYQSALYQFMQSDKKHKGPQTINDILELEYNFYVLALNMDLFVQFENLQKR